jgi:hypothetical protein
MLQRSPKRSTKFVSKKPKPTPKPMTELEAALLAALKDSPGGLSKDILDNAFWRDQHMPDDHWVAALDKLDRLGDRKPLTDLLRSDCEIQPSVREHLANLIERGVPAPKNRPPNPSYKFSKIDTTWYFARERVQAYTQRGMSRKEALEKVAGEIGRTVGQLVDNLKRKR